MTFHDDSGKKEPTGAKRKIVPIAKRKVMGDCEPGDVLELEDGKRLVMTARISGGTFGRFLDEDGREGEIAEFPTSLPISRIRGHK